MNERSENRLVSVLAPAAAPVIPGLFPHTAHGMYHPKHGCWVPRRAEWWVEAVFMATWDDKVAAW